MRRGLIVTAFAVLTAALAACTALLDLSTARFDAPSGDGGPGNDGDVGDGGDGNGDSAIPTTCPAQLGEFDGSLPTDTMCDGGLVQLSTNPLNCGGCGHSCEGGTCNNGECAAETIATDGPQATILGVNETSIAWALDHDAGAATEFRIAELDGKNARSLGTVEGGTWLFGAVTKNYVFVPLEPQTSMAYPIDGSPPFPVTGTIGSIALVSRDDDVFFDVTNRTRLAKLHLEPNAQAKGLLDNELLISDLTLGGVHLYWVASTTPAAGGDPRVGRLNLDTGVKDVSEWSGHASAIAVDGTYAYVFDATRGELLRLAANLAGPADVLARWTGEPWTAASTIHATGDFIYVHVRRGGPYGSVLRVPRCGGSPIILQTFVSLGRSVLAGDYFYFGSYNEGGVHRVHR